ncbi:hypothetical protein MKZ38_005391 [Zalerion maritima]|uniref:Uncharacterized protein n=1 Tax=Zalerion maritima TaxID=339359 RepID=A0AAD5WQB5_9PEZI|nr:hypothetical protein MKZ38_005391 [Zalerion maritima]
MNGKSLPRTCNSFLSLPDTAWDMILECLRDDSTALANLAQTNSRCNLLAKSAQFCTIHLTYSDNTIELLTFIAESTLHQQEQRRQGHHPDPTLGAFVREIVVRTNPDHIASRHKFGTCHYPAHSDGLDPVELSDRIQCGDDFYFEDYIGCISYVVEMGAVPNLFTFDWRDRVTIPQTLVQSLLKSPMKDLKLGGFVNLIVPKSHDEERTHCAPELRHLILHGITEPEDSIEKSPHYDHLLAIAAPTLETLCFSRKPRTSSGDIFYNRSLQPEFPNLRTLMIGTPLSEMSTTSLFCAPKLHTLIIDGLNTIAYNQAGHLGSIGHIPTLKTLICRRKIQGGRTEIPEFLAKNPQITKLVLQTSHLDEVLQVLVNQFHELKSLSLTTHASGSLTVEHASLLSELKSLEQLHLSVNPEGELMTYDHDLLMQNLQHLPRLRKLAFTQDTFQRFRRPSNKRLGSDDIITSLINTHQNLVNTHQNLINIQNNLSIIQNNLNITNNINNTIAPVQLLATSFVGLNDPSRYYSSDLLYPEEFRLLNSRPYLDRTYYEDPVAFPWEKEGGAPQYDTQAEVTSYSYLKPKEKWERMHRNRMLDLAEEYGRKVKGLEFMFVGQRVIALGQEPLRAKMRKEYDGDKFHERWLNFEGGGEGEEEGGGGAQGGRDEPLDDRDQDQDEVGEGKATSEGGEDSKTRVTWNGSGDAEEVSTRTVDDEEDVMVVSAMPLTKKREELLTYIYNTWGHHVETWGWDY